MSNSGPGRLQRRSTEKLAPAFRLEVRDNGDGFVVEDANGGGIGLIGMKERAEQIGATLSVSSNPGAGTRIVAVSPYQNLSV